MTKQFSTSDLSRRSGDIIAEAMRRPVTITQRNKPRFVLLNIEDYERMRRQADPRRVLKIGDLSESELDELEQALEEYAAAPEAAE